MPTDNTAADNLTATIERDRAEAIANLNAKFDLLLDAIRQTYGWAGVKAKVEPKSEKPARKARAQKPAAAADDMASLGAQVFNGVAAPANDNATSCAVNDDGTLDDGKHDITDPTAMLDNRTSVVNMLRLDGPSSMNEIVAHLSTFGVSELDAKSCVKGLLADATIFQTGKARGTKYALGAIASSANEPDDAGSNDVGDDVQ